MSAYYPLTENFNSFFKRLNPKQSFVETAAREHKTITGLLEDPGAEFPSAGACWSDDLVALLTHLRLPWRLRTFVRTTNLCERSCVEERRRSKTLPRFFTEKSCLTLVFATVRRAAERWQRIALTPLEYQQLQLVYQERGLVPARPLAQVA